MRVARIEASEGVRRRGVHGLVGHFGSQGRLGEHFACGDQNFRRWPRPGESSTPNPSHISQTALAPSSWSPRRRVPSPSSLGSAESTEAWMLASVLRWVPASSAARSRAPGRASAAARRSLAFGCRRRRVPPPSSTLSACPRVLLAHVDGAQRLLIACAVPTGGEGHGAGRRRDARHESAAP